MADWNAVSVSNPPSNRATDWDAYYHSVPPTASLTRKYTTRVLLDAIRRFVTASQPGGVSIVEIGGANSCFLNAMLAGVKPRSYDIIDTNAYGLSLLEKHPAAGSVVHAHQESVLAMSYSAPADLVFSVGLVEHFDAANTRRAVAAHFGPLRPGGVAIITFPTPTLLYRLSRMFIEAIGMWKFHDERPLRREEVVATVEEFADVMEDRILWPQILTQHLVVARKR